MATCFVPISVFECQLDLRKTGGSLSITAGKKPSDLVLPRYQVQPNQLDNGVYIEVLTKIAKAIQNGETSVTLAVENDQFIIKMPQVAASPMADMLIAAAPKGKAAAKTPSTRRTTKPKNQKKASRKKNAG